jgi:hypothetical protein
MLTSNASTCFPLPAVPSFSRAQDDAGSESAEVPDEYDEETEEVQEVQQYVMPAQDVQTYVKFLGVQDNSQSSRPNAPSARNLLASRSDFPPVLIGSLLLLFFAFSTEFNAGEEVTALIGMVNSGPKTYNVSYGQCSQAGLDAWRVLRSLD